MTTCSSILSGAYCGCFKHLGLALAVGELLLRRRVEVGAELRERRHLAVLREVELQRTGDTDFIAFVWAAPPTRLTDRPTFTAGRTPELNRSVSRKTCPSVIEMTLVGM